jgi:hypothetical protein
VKYLTLFTKLALYIYVVSQGMLAKNSMLCCSYAQSADLFHKPAGGLMNEDDLSSGHGTSWSSTLAENGEVSQSNLKVDVDIQGEY